MLLREYTLFSNDQQTEVLLTGRRVFTLGCIQSCRFLDSLCLMTKLNGRSCRIRDAVILCCLQCRLLSSPLCSFRRPRSRFASFASMTPLFLRWRRHRKLKVMNKWKVVSDRVLTLFTIFPSLTFAEPSVFLGFFAKRLDRCASGA